MPPLKIPKYVHCTNKLELQDYDGFGFILHTEYPFIVGQIRCCRSDQELMEFTASNKDIAYSQIQGYNIIIHASSTLSRKIPGSKLIKQHFEQVVHEMASFFLESVILEKPKAYERFKY
jgi:hypothetical protein